MPTPSRVSSSSSTEKQWTTRNLLAWIGPHLKAKDVDSPRVVAEMLLSHVLGCERMRLYMDVDRPASPQELATLRELVARAAKHEPVQYLVGHAWFFSRQYKVDRSTLIPRACTETLVEHVLQWLRVNPGHAAPVIADVGTGTGCIGVSIAVQLESAHVIATDIKPEALALARENAAKHAVADRMEFIEGSGIGAIIAGKPGVRFDVIASNPPYIPDSEWEGGAVGRNVREFEPVSALRGGADGLDVIGPLIAEAPAILKPGGLLAIEIANAHREAVMTLAIETRMLDDVQLLRDHEGLWRVLTARRCMADGVPQ